MGVFRSHSPRACLSLIFYCIFVSNVLRDIVHEHMRSLCTVLLICFFVKYIYRCVSRSCYESLEKTLTINGSEVALNDVNIQLKYDRLKPVDVHHFMSYIKKTEAISDNDEQSKDYIDNASLELMLIGHSWQDYMKGMGTPEERDADLQKILDNGGTFFDYIDQLEGPESLKNKLREAYCEARIEEYIKPLLDPYPIHGSYDEKDNWAKKKVNLVQKYKKDHPDYLQEIIQEEINKRK